MLEIKILLKESIGVKEVGEIYNPTIKDIINLGEDRLNEYLSALAFSKDSLPQDESSTFLEKLTNFDIVYLITDKNFRKTLLEAIGFFTQKEVMLFDEVSMIGIGKQNKLYKDNYDEFVDVILKMFLRERAKPEHKKKQKMSERQRKIYEKLTKYRKKQREKESLKLIDIINIVKHGGASFISAEEIKNMTYFELMKCFEVIMSKSNYDEYIRYKTSPNFKVEDTVQHWTLSIKHSAK